MANAEKDRIEAETLAALQSDPELTALAAQIQKIPFRPARPGELDTVVERRRLIEQYRQMAEQKGLIPKNYQAQFTPDGVDVDFQNWFERNASKLPIYAAAALLTGGVAANMAGAGAAAGTGSAGGASTGATAGTTTAAGGSLLSKVPKLLQDVAPTLSALSSGRAAGRQSEDAANIVYDAANVRRSESAQDNYQRNLQNALRGGLLQGVQDSTIEAPAGIPMGKISDGLRPSAILGREDIGKNLQAAATKNLLGMDESGETNTPAMTPRPESNAFDTTLNTLAPILSITDLLLDNKRRMSSPAPPPPTPGVTFRNAGMNGVRFLPPPSGGY